MLKCTDTYVISTLCLQMLNLTLKMQHLIKGKGKKVDINWKNKN